MILWSLLVDFGLVILIWMTQLIVYPSFIYYQPIDLTRWHDRYTTTVSAIVLPLMIAQVGLHVAVTLNNFSVWNIIAGILVFTVWVHTFFFAMQLHGQVAKNPREKAFLVKLLKINWYRTVAWTLIFLIRFIELTKIDKLFH